MKFIFLFAILLSTSACVSMPTRKPVGVSNPIYLSDQAPAPTPDVKEMVSDLTRDIKVHGVEISAIPMTGALLQTVAKEDGYREGLNSKDIDQKVSEIKKSVGENLCFSVTFYSEDYDGTVIKYWGAQLIDQKLQSHNLVFVNRDEAPKSKTTTKVGSYSTGGYLVGDYYVPSTTNVYSYDETRHSSIGTACFNKRTEAIDLSQNFALKLHPRFKRDLKPIYLVWKRVEDHSPPTQISAGSNSSY